MKDKNYLKKKSVIAGAAIIAICIVVFALLAGGRAAAKRVEELIDLGNKYLTEQDYEQAAVTFQEVIEIEPKCEDAYRGLADAYVAMGDYESAFDALQQGIEQTGTEGLAAYLEEIKEDYARLQEEAAVREREEAEAAERAKEQEELIGRIAIREIARISPDGDTLDWEQAIVDEMNAKGNEISRIWYYDYPSGSVQETQEYADGEFMKYTHYNTDGTVAWGGENKCEYEYDADGNIVKASHYDESGWLESVDEYDVDGKIVKSLLASELDGPIDAYADYEYDADGNEIKVTSYNSEGAAYSEYQKEYDSQGRLVREIFYSNGELISDKTYSWECENGTVSLCEYEYLDGNLVRETFYGETGEVLKENLY